MTPAHVAQAFAGQSKACASLDSPFMAQLMQLFATRDWPDGKIKTRIFSWDGDLGPGAQSVPLRLAGALHALHLQGHNDLAPFYPPHQASNDELWEAVAQAMTSDADAIDAFIDNAPQTNEVRRAATLIAVAHWLTARYDRPIRTSELGASGGLNLHWDQFGLALPDDQQRGAVNPVLRLTPDWIGPLPPDNHPTVVSRAGVDINPLDPKRDALRLQAYLWPDQPARLTLTRAAIDATTTRVDQNDAIDWLAPKLAHVPGQLHLIYSTVAWQYFPAEKQALGTELIAAAGATATPDTPLAWFGMENDGGRGAGLTLRLWPGDHHFDLGRADFHGRWIDWQAPNASIA